MELTPEDIRYLRPTQLAHLTGFTPSDFAAWSRQRKISERSLERISERTGISKLVFLSGLELRRQDSARSKEAQRKIERLLAELKPFAEHN
jgi:hypothetical protein